MTSAEFTAYESRQRMRQAPQEATSDACEDEGDLHARISAECRRRGWIALHGSMAEPTHRTEGEPDFVILGTKCLKATKEFFNMPDLGETIPEVWFIECKKRKAKPSITQQAMIHHAEKLGHTIHVVRSFKEFLEVVKS